MIKKTKKSDNNNNNNKTKNKTNNNNKKNKKMTNKKTKKTQSNNNNNTRAIRGHQLRRVLLFSHGDIPLLPIAPKWRPLPSTDRLPKLISRSRARLRNWKESGSQFTRSHRAKRISEAGAIDDRLLLAEAVDLEALRPKKKSLKEVIRGGDTDE
ncbi:hypothetical protein T492DRAFT_838020 [Pavlovales sp. CCMP2436]|nr:hypothetical protein T492DRAFT_838020 [Pavlovales sp. CCMP2436]